MKQLAIVGTLCAALCLPSMSAHAVLVDRGGGMLYDTVLNITWLQDANYAKTSGYCGGLLLVPWTPKLLALAQTRRG